MFEYNKNDSYFKAIQRKRFRPSIANDSIDDKSCKQSVDDIIQAFQNYSIGNINEESKNITKDSFAEIPNRALLPLEDFEESKSNILRFEDIKDDSDYGWIIALTENRAREVGFAWISLRNFSIELTQISDTQTYVNTCKK